MDFVSLIPSFGGLLYTLVAFVVALSIIVAIHEYGHYIVGRWCGIHAEVYSLGFGPVIFSRTDRHGTRWQLAALPLGGYVRFLGDSDAASGKEAGALDGLSAAERRRTMHGAPLWARALTVAAGPVFNFVLSVVVFIGLFLVIGVPTATTQVGTLHALPGVQQALQPGDEILSVDGRKTPDSTSFANIADRLPPAESVTYGIRRDGEEMTVTGPFPLPPYVAGVQPDSAADAAGIETGDVIRTINGTPIYAFAQLRADVGASGGKPLQMTVWRDGQTRQVTLTPRRSDLPTAGGGFETRWLMGISGGYFFEPRTRTPNPLEAASRAVSQTVYIVTTSLSGLYHMITGAISTCNLRGPIGIAETSGAAASQGAQSFISFIAMLSTAVGLLNLFPVPVLDGGHLVFFAWEAVAGRPPSDRALRVLMGGGLFLILALMVFALSNDILCP